MLTGVILENDLFIRIQHVHENQVIFSERRIGKMGRPVAYWNPFEYKQKR